MIERARNKIKDIFDWYKLTSFLLFLIVILLLAFIVVRLDRGLQFYSLRLIVLLAGLVGLILAAIKRLHPISLSLISVASGVVVVFTVVGGLLQPFMDFLQTAFSYLPPYWRYIFTDEEILLPDTSLLQEKWAFLDQAVSVLYGRLQTWLATLPEPAYDPVSLNLIWGIVLWILSIWIYWFVVKKKLVMAGVLPPIVIIASIYQTIGEGIYVLILVLGIGLLLEILAKQAQREDFWHRHHLTFTDVIRKRATQNALVLSITLVLIASTISSPKIDDFIEEMRERRRKTASSSQVGDEVVEVGFDEESLIGPEEVIDQASDGRLPNVHLVRSSPDLADIEVLHAVIDEGLSPREDRYYLRSATYEVYTLGGWHTLNKGFIYTPPEEEFEIDFTPNERLIYQEVTFLEEFQEGNLMYVVGELAAANVNYYASYHTKFVNDTYTDLFATVTEAPQYAAYSSTPYFGEDELRDTSLEYPDWIANKYLQIPTSVPDRVYELALSLTATQPTQYDRALAIEQYLRQFEYTLDIEDPPNSRDIVDYFLFDLQKGYCDYYASSMVILARAAGIPARLATGYLAGTYDAENDQFIVTADQAHSWAEVYFTDYGWVTFEPTAGRPSLERLEEREILSEEEFAELDLDLPDQNAEDATQFTLLPNNLFVLIGQLLVVMVIGLLTAHWIDRQVLQSMAPGKMFARLYRRLRKIAKRGGVRTQETDTPLEFSKLLTTYLAQHGMGRLVSRVLNSAPQNAELIIAACNHAAYANSLPDAETIRHVIMAWGQLRWQLFLTRILVRLQPVSAELRRIWTRIQQPA